MDGQERLVCTAENLCAYDHGPNWEEKVDENGFAWAMQRAEELFYLKAWVEAHRQ
jgi:hypothetical protein